MHRSTFALPALLWLCVGCTGGGGGAPASATPPATAPRPEAALTAGDAGRLAAELLIEAGEAQPGPLRDPAAPVAGAALRKELAVAALDHLRSEALGAGAGPGLAGSQRIRRLARAMGAPPDRNGNGTNWDETLAAETARIAAFAGTTPDVGAQVLFPWPLARAEPLAPLLPAGDPAPATWRTARAGPLEVRLEHIGAAMRARAVAAGRLLRLSRPGFAGPSAADGLLGLVLVEQLLAAEETVLGALFTAGGPLLGLEAPRTYDPQAGLRWLPASIGVTMAGNLPDAPDSYRARDGASDLLGLASVLEGAVELAWIAGDRQPSPALRSVFTGQPFAPPDPGPPPPHVLNWEQDIGPLVVFRCGGCHLGFPTGGFQIDTLALLLQGSPRTRSLGLPMVVPGDHAASFLHTILTGPPPPFERMPLGSSLPAAEIQTIDDWIDAGALESAPAPPPPPAPGADLARVCFLDLVAMHFDPATGALHHRHEGDGPSGVATALATGRALQALRALGGAMPDLEYQGRRPDDVLAAAAAFAAARLLDASGRAREWQELGPGAREARAGDLPAQAALAAGLLAACERLPPGHPAHAAAARAVACLLTDFRDPATGRFEDRPGRPFARLLPATLADLLAALRGAATRGDDAAAAAQRDLLASLRPALRFSEWGGHGEVLGDGIADTDGDGVPEPALAGGAFGRLPLLPAALLAGDLAQAPPPRQEATWSAHVRPLLLARCGDCHFGGNEQGGYRLDTVRSAATAGQSGGVLPLLVPGDPEHSFLLRKLVDRLPAIGAQMPLARPPLEDRARALVRQWILDGATGR